MVYFSHFNVLMFTTDKKEYYRGKVKLFANSRYDILSVVLNIQLNYFDVIFVAIPFFNELQNRA